MLFTEDDGLSCRWMQAYNLVADSLVTRFDCILPTEGSRALQEPRQQFNHIDRETIEFALEFHAEQIEDCKRRARARPGTQFSVNWLITHQEMAQHRYNGYQAEERGRQRDQQLRARQREDFLVTETPRVDILYGHQFVQPGRHVGLYSDNPDERNAAYAKATELLKSWLSASQLVEFEKDARFTVIGSDTDTHYRLVSERSYNILELDSTGELTGQKFCVVPAQSVALGDQLLAQKIWLETDELRTLKIANKIARTGSTGRNNLAVRNIITREAIQMFQNSNTFLHNFPQYEELLGEPERPTQTDD